jgi:tetratricopeptide (TPR) repeat protein
LYAGDRPALDGLDGLGDDDLSQVALMLPDYSTDPDIASLAAEMLTPQADELPISPSSDSSTAPLYDWLQAMDKPEPAADSTVANLVQQLSRPAAIPGEQTLAADLTENLLPQANSPTQLDGFPAPPAEPPTRVDPSTGLRKPKPKRALPVNLLAWGGLGLAGLGVVLGLAITTLSTANRPTPVAPVPPVSSGDGLTQPPTTNAALLEASVTALTLGNTEMARKQIEQLLDRSDFLSAESALAAVPPNLLEDPNIAYLRGRLIWQQVATGRSADASLYDAMRAWTQATEGRSDFIAAWVALGFAHYALGDYGSAIQAWEKAIAIDQKQQRDINPEAGPQVANLMTVNAYAGLAMAHHQEGVITLLPEEQLPFEQQAQTYFSQALALNPNLINPNALALNWLWSPALISDWQATVAQLAASGGSTGLDSNP